MNDTIDQPLGERMEYAAGLKKKMNCCQAVLVAFADKLGRCQVLIHESDSLYQDGTNV